MDKFQVTALVVDDNRVNLRLLQLCLGKFIEIIHTAENGQEALEVAKNENIDVFVLDVEMPIMNGFQLSKNLREQEIYRHNPIIFITGAINEEHIQKGFEVGGIDYITKPFKMSEVKRRISTHLENYENRRRLKNFASEMEQLANERAEALVHADRLATLGTLSAGVAHEINNPTTFISGNIQMFEKFWSVIEPILLEAKKEELRDESQLEFILEEVPKIFCGVKNGVDRITKIVSGLKSFSRKKSSDKKSFEPLDIKELIDSSIFLSTSSWKNKIKIENLVLESSTCIMGENQAVVQVLINLIVNACHALEECENPKIIISLLETSENTVITISDNGPGIAPQVMEKLFTPFFTTKGAGKGTGLGLSISQNIMKDHNGFLKVFNLPDRGAAFTLTFPNKESI